MSVVVATPDVVGARMAGPGIRAWHFARELGKHAPTTLIATIEDGTAAGDGFRLVARDSAEAAEAMRRAEVLIGQPARRFGRRRRGQFLVYDLFDPSVLELREIYGSAPSVRQRIHLAAEWMRLADALTRGDLLICAAPQQRRFYATLQSSDTPWIEVPFGIDVEERAPCAPPPEPIVIWGGGTWEWLDPRTAVDAVVRLNASGTRCKLLFLGRRRPNRALVDRRRDDRFDALLAAGGDHVSANEEWVPYRERLSWLCAGKVAIMLHRPTAEAEFAIRTRIFDAIAAGLPVVATASGWAAELVEREEIGVVVPPGDAGAVARALERLLSDDVFYSRCVSNLERLRPRYAWQNVTRPLVEAVQKWLTSRSSS